MADEPQEHPSSSTVTPGNMEDMKKNELLRMRQMIRFLETSCRCSEETIAKMQKELEEARSNAEPKQVRKYDALNPDNLEFEKVQHQVTFLHSRLTQYRRENGELRDQLGMGPRSDGPIPPMCGPAKPRGLLPVMHFHEQVDHKVYLLRSECSELRQEVGRAVTKVNAMCKSIREYNGNNGVSTPFPSTNRV
eukprot:PhF_6_TR8652/c0_g1_i2/m.13521